MVIEKAVLGERLYEAYVRALATTALRAGEPEPPSWESLKPYERQAWVEVADEAKDYLWGAS